jgi:NAD(P)-dependent dehydrogenase (short-subunit alcohol dehydrogenase family)
MKVSELFNVSGKVAVVTGGSRGIGEMISAGFLANGVKVYVTARKEEPLVKKAEELSNKYGGACIPIACDLSSSIGIDYFVKQIREKEEFIDFLINNAGAAWGEPYNQFSEVGWDKVMDLNVKSLFFLTQKLTEMLKRNASIDDPSRVINIGSID